MLFSALAPVVILLSGAGLLMLLGWALSPQDRGILALLAAGGAFVALLLLGGALPTHSTISLWHPQPLFGSGLAYQVDGLAFLFASALALLGLAALIASLDRPGRVNGRLYAALLTLLAAGLSFVLSANWLTLCLSWAFLDLAFFLALLAAGRGARAARAALRGLGTSYLAGLALLAAALLLSGGAGGQGYGGEIASAPLLARPSLFLLFGLAALVRAGAYPLYFWVPIEVETEPEVRALLHLLPAGAGLYLLIRLCSLAGMGSSLAAFGALSFAVGAFLAWAEGRGRLSFIVLSQVGCVILSAALAGPQETAATLWPAINLLLCLGLLFLSRRGTEATKEVQGSFVLSAAVRNALASGLRRLVPRIRSRAPGLDFAPLASRFQAPLAVLGRASRAGLWPRVPLGVALASLFGLPLTMGFIGRRSFYRLLLARGQWGLLALSLLIEALFFAALLEIRFLSTPPSGWARLAGGAALATPIVVLGIRPSLWASWALPPGGPTSIVLWLALLLPPVGGYLLHHWRRWALGCIRWTALSAALRLEWLYGLLWRAALRIGAALRGVAELSEGRGYLGWIALAVLVVFLLLAS